MGRLTGGLVFTIGIAEEEGGHPVQDCGIFLLNKRGRYL